MALFGAPLDDPQHADHAVEAALDMVEELAELNARWAAEGRPELDIGIGINTGPMIAGNIGSDAIMSYTVIGDAVNLGSRLESLNKQYGTRIIISDATRQRLSCDVPAAPARRRRRQGQDAAGRDFRGRSAGTAVHTRSTGMKQAILVAAIVALAVPAHAQFGGLGMASRSSSRPSRSTTT